MQSIRKIFLLIVVFFIFFYFCVAAFIAFYPVMNDIEGKRYLGVVFGAGITRSGDPSLALKLRLDKALELYGDQKISKIFISGRTAETSIMKNYLLKNGISLNNIIEDSDGKNTLVTINNVKNFTLKNDTGNGIVFISQRYHIPRIVLITWKKGLSEVSFIAADTKKVDRHERYFFLARESLGFIKSLLFD